MLTYDAYKDFLSFPTEENLHRIAKRSISATLSFNVFTVFAPRYIESLYLALHWLRLNEIYIHHSEKELQENRMTFFLVQYYIHCMH